MTQVGIEAMNVFGGSAFVEVIELARHRELDDTRFQNLMMHQKAVALPVEDPVTFGVNAAWPIVASLTEAERDRIEMLVTCTESGIDFGKSLSTYIHHYLGLHRNCRLFELKQACYAGTAGFQAAVNFVLSQVSPGAKALVVTSDISRFSVVDGNVAETDWSFVEPSSGAGAVAILVGESPTVFAADPGANGYYGFEVMDSCRPIPDSEAGDSDLSLMSYLDCCQQSFEEYRRRVEGTDYRTTFRFLAFHTPFGGMVKGAHRTMMRRIAKAPPAEIEADFDARVAPGLRYCQRVGNIMGGTVFLALASIIDNAAVSSPVRTGCFSYGSGCCSEFFSGVVSPAAPQRQRSFAIGRHLDERHRLTIQEYEDVLHSGDCVKFGTRDRDLDAEPFRPWLAHSNGDRRLLLKRIRQFHREYEWQ